MLGSDNFVVTAHATAACTPLIRQQGEHIQRASFTHVRGLNVWLNVAAPFLTDSRVGKVARMPPSRSGADVDFCTASFLAGRACPDSRNRTRSGLGKRVSLFDCSFPPTLLIRMLYTALVQNVGSEPSLRWCDSAAQCVRYTAYYAMILGCELASKNANQREAVGWQQGTLLSTMLLTAL